MTFDIIADQAFGFDSGCVAGSSSLGWELAKAVATTLQLVVRSGGEARAMTGHVCRYRYSSFNVLAVQFWVSTLAVPVYISV